MDADAEIGRDPLSKHQIEPEYGDEQTDARRDCRTRLARPNSQARTGTEIFIFPVQLTTSRTGNLTRLILTLAINVMTIHITYMHTCIRLSFSDLCILLFLFLSLCRLCVCVFLCSHWSLVDVPLIFFCPADHVPDWQLRVLLGMVEARSVNVKKTNNNNNNCSCPSAYFFS